MIFRMVYKSGQIFIPFCHNSRVWQTDGQSDRRTELSSLYRVCITYSAVKIALRLKKDCYKVFLC